MPPQSAALGGLPKIMAQKVTNTSPTTPGLLALCEACRSFKRTKSSRACQNAWGRLHTALCVKPTGPLGLEQANTWVQPCSNAATLAARLSPLDVQTCCTAMFGATLCCWTWLPQYTKLKICTCVQHVLPLKWQSTPVFLPTALPISFSSNASNFSSTLITEAVIAQTWQPPTPHTGPCLPS